VCASFYFLISHRKLQRIPRLSKIVKKSVSKSIVEKLGRNLEEIWKKFGRNLEEIWKKFGRNLEEIWKNLEEFQATLTSVIQLIFNDDEN